MAKTSDTTTFDGKNAWVYGEIILPWHPDIMLSDQGWGKTSDGGDSSDVLLEVDLPVVSNELCVTSVAYLLNMTVADLQSDVDTDSIICAGGVEGKDSCKVSTGPPALLSPS